MRIALVTIFLAIALTQPAFSQGRGKENGKGNSTEAAEGPGNSDNGNGGRGPNGDGPGSGSNAGPGSGNNGNSSGPASPGNSPGRPEVPGGPQSIGIGTGAGPGAPIAGPGRITAPEQTVTPVSPDFARDAASSGQAQSLSSLVPDVTTRTGGDMIDAELLQVDGFLVYALKVLRPSGQVTTEYYYAQSGRFIGSEP